MSLEERPRQLLEALSAATRLSAEQPRIVGELTSLGFRQDACKALETASALPGGAPHDHEAMGFLAFSLGLHEVSRKHYAQVTRLAPRDAMAWYNLASAERNIGAFDAAETACETALALDQNLAQAALLRSSLRVQTAERNHVEELQALTRRARPRSGEWIFLHYALGKEFDDIGEYRRAWQHYAEGAAARRGTIQYDVAGDVAKLDRIRTVFDGSGLCGPTTPIRQAFIAGLPRSGTTLIERVLTAAPNVSTNGETDNLLGALMDGTPASGGDIFQRVAHASPDIVAASYARRAGEPGPGGLVLEKLPLNYLYFGAIAKTLPDARLVLVRRQLVDNCFAMFSTLFGVGYPFSYSLDDLGTYAIAFHSLMEHWKSCLGDRLLEVSYDSFVSDPVRHGPSIAAHVGMNWLPDMLEVEKNRRATSTASAAQVRRPIYRTASGRWRNYEAELAPLLDRLSAAEIL